MTLLPLLVACASVPTAIAVGTWRPLMAGAASVVGAGLAFVAAIAAWSQESGPVNVPWAPARSWHLALALDGFAFTYVLLATGVGFLVLAYSRRYLPLHLEHQGRSHAEATRFYGLMLLFMAAMVGLAMAQDLVLIFVFWDITAIASYFLIGFDRADGNARAAALMAMLVTGITAVALLIAALLLYGAHGTFSVPELADRVSRRWSP